MKIVLFALGASYVHTNLAVRCLREPLLRLGYDVKIIEKNLRDRQDAILHELYAERADIYSFSVYIWNLTDMLRIAADLKTLLPDSIIVFGGPEVSFATERFDDCAFIDHIICGEGEISFSELCSEYYSGKCPAERVIQGKPHKDFERDGILYDRDDICLDSMMLYYESSRGCPYNCSYCLSSSIHGVKAKTAEKTLDDLMEFEKLPHKFDIIKFVDRTFNFDIKRANTIWRALYDEKYTKTYHFEICASLLNEESFDILKGMPKGKIQLEIGLQSTNPRTLAEVSRHILPDAVIENVKRICDFGNMHVHVDLIAGLPYESYERFGESFDALYGNCDMLQLGFLKLLHGTRLRYDAEKYGYKYLSKPPYTVLASDDITYDEIYLLEDIAALLKRYYESGHFCHSLGCALSYIDSPFKFYEGLAHYIKEKDGRPITAIGQADAYRLFYEYSLYLGAEKEKMKSVMAEDFRSAEIRRLPDFLR